MIEEFNKKIDGMTLKRKVLIIVLLLLLFIGTGMLAYDLYMYRAQINDSNETSQDGISYYYKQNSGDYELQISEDVLKNLTSTLNQS